jgi:thioredoxin-like negative regulator of GroEL
MAAFGDERVGNSPNREELLQLAIGAAQAGNRESARVMFRQVLSEDPYNERALMWMAKLATTKAERRQWLTRVLQVNPLQQSAKDALRRMDYKRSARDNRVLFIYGFIAVLLVIAAVATVVVVLSGR